MDSCACLILLKILHYTAEEVQANTPSKLLQAHTPPGGWCLRGGRRGRGPAQANTPSSCRPHTPLGPFTHTQPHIPATPLCSATTDVMDKFPQLNTTFNVDGTDMTVGEG